MVYTLRKSLDIKDGNIKKWFDELDSDDRFDDSAVDKETYRLIRRVKSRAMDFVQVSDESLFTAMHKGVEAWFQIKEGDYAPAMFTLAAGFKEILSDDNQVVLTLLTASGELASAKSPDEVSATIARYALPVASHKIKKTHTGSLMLSAYVGPSVTSFIDASKPFRELSFQLLGVIGPEYAFGMKGKQSLSIMLTLLDLGNIIQYRMNSDTTESDNVSFSRVISPGILVGYAPIRTWPVAFTASYMAFPHRLQLGATVDMPLIGLHKRKK